MYNDDFQLHASGKAGVGVGGAYMTWLLLATEPSKVVAYPCHYKITILSSTEISFTLSSIGLPLTEDDLLT